MRKIDMTGKTVAEVNRKMEALVNAGFTCSVEGTVNEVMIIVEK